MSVHEGLAQRASETRLEEYLYNETGECECHTCIVREVLDAAWPHLRNLAREEAADELEAVVRKHANGEPATFARELGLLAKGWFGRD